jgi:hypothetical protein
MRSGRFFTIATAAAIVAALAVNVIRGLSTGDWNW